MARIPNEELEKIRNTFGVNPEFLLSDSNDYTMDAPAEVEDGIASIDTGLPIYTRDGEGNNFLQYNSMDGAPGYIRPTKIDAPVNSFLKGPEFYQNNAMTEKEYADRISKIREYNKNLDSSYTDEDLREIINLQNQKKPEKTGILESIKDKGFDILDFIKGGGLSGLLAKTFLGEQDPRATFLRDYYGGEDGSNLTSTGSIASGLMAGYNPVSGSNFLNKISGGFLSGQTFGLQNAYDRRIATIMKTLATKYKDGNYDNTLLDERLAKLREEKRKEAEALRAAENRRLASQNQVRLGSNLIQDNNYRSDPGLSKQGREQYTGPGMAFEKRNTGTGKGPR